MSSSTPGSTVNVVFVGICMTVNYGANGTTPPAGLPPVRVIIPSVPTSVTVGDQTFTPAQHTSTLYYTPDDGPQTSFALGSSTQPGGYTIQVLDPFGSGENDPNPAVFNMSVASNVPSMTDVLGLQSNPPALNPVYATAPASPNTTVNCWFDITGGTFVACMNTSAGPSGPVLMFAAIPTTSAAPVLQITPFGDNPTVQQFTLETDDDNNAFIQLSNSPTVAGAITTQDFGAYYAMLTYPTEPSSFPTSPAPPATNPCSGYVEPSGGSGEDDAASVRLKKIARDWQPFFTGAECSNSQYP